MGKLVSPRQSDQAAVGHGLAQVLPQDGVPWYRKRHLIILNAYAYSLSLLAAANGFDGTMINGLQALPAWQEFMNHPTGAWLGFIGAAQPLSSTIAYPIIAYFANRWGRKKGLFIGFVFLFLGIFLQAFAPNQAAFILGRFFLGQPSAWWGGLSPLIITEIAYPTHRAFLTSLYNSGCDSWAWRIPSILQAAIPVMVLPFAILVPESPRFLVSQGKRAEAKKMLTKFHAGGDENSTLVDFELEEIETAIQAEKDAASRNAPTGLAVIPFLFIYYAFYDIAFTPLLVSYPAEIWSYTLRARGTALTQMSTYAAIFFNTFVNPIALNDIGWKYYAVFAVILLEVTITIYFLYPETRGHTLEEMAVVFGEGDAVAEVSKDVKHNVEATHKETV
ncbi:hypothetical protein V2G26_004148 [Clonostachys chloroleuca]